MTIPLRNFFFGIFGALFTPGAVFQRANHEKWIKKYFFGSSVIRMIKQFRKKLGNMYSKNRPHTSYLYRTFSWNWMISFFLIFRVVLKILMKLCNKTRIIFFSTGGGDFACKMGQKLMKKLFINFLYMVYNESLYYLLCSCTNLTWAKILSAYQIVGFLNYISRMKLA